MSFLLAKEKPVVRRRKGGHMKNDARKQVREVRWEWDDRGDVPGWVLVTLMTAGLVAGLWALAGPTLADVFTSAIDSVTGG